VIGRSRVWKFGVVARLVFVFFFGVFSLGGWGDATLTEAWELFKRGPAEFSALLMRFFETGALIVTEDELLRILFLIALLRGFVPNISSSNISSSLLSAPLFSEVGAALSPSSPSLSFSSELTTELPTEEDVNDTLPLPPVPVFGEVGFFEVGTSCENLQFAPFLQPLADLKNAHGGGLPSSPPLGLNSL